MSAKVLYTAPAFEAVRQGDLAKLHEYLTLGLNPLVTNDHGDTLLHTAARCGQVTVLRWLATVQKLSLEMGGEIGRTPLHVAAINGQLQSMAALVDAGADKHAKDNQGNQAIHLAALFSNAASVKFCRDELGQSLEARGFNRQTPLLRAVIGGNVEVMRWLVAQDADKNPKDRGGNQAIHLAAMFADADTVMFCRDELGQSVDALGFNGRTPLMQAASKSNLSTIRRLTALGANIHVVAARGENLLTMAKLSKDAKTIAYVEQLLSKRS